MGFVNQQIAGITLPYDNLQEIRQRMADISPTLVRCGQVEEANFFQQSVEIGKVRTTDVVCFFSFSSFFFSFIVFFFLPDHCCTLVSGSHNYISSMNAPDLWYNLCSVIMPLS